MYCFPSSIVTSFTQSIIFQSFIPYIQSNNNDDPKQQCDFNEQEYVVFERLRKAEKLAEFFDTWVIKPTWILDSIAAFKLQPVSDCF